MGSLNLPNAIDTRFRGELDADFVNYYNRIIAIKPATHSIDIKEIRAFPEKFHAPWARDYSYEPFVKNTTIPTGNGKACAVRIYYPDARISPFGQGPYPVHVNFHGGGFVLGDLTGDAELMMLVRNRLGIMVVDVDYRLAPGKCLYFV